MTSSPKERLTPFGNAVTGAAGALIANLSVFPLDVIKTRLQVQSRTLNGITPTLAYKSTMDALIKIVKSEGIAGLYSGLGVGLFGTVCANFTYFYWYSIIRGNYAKRVGGEKKIGAAMELLLGAISGAISQFFILPIAVVTTRQQTTPKEEKLSLSSTLNQIIKDDGFFGLWKGLQPSLLLCVNPAITYGVFERLKKSFLSRSGKNYLTSGETFLVGAIAKTLATIVTYPYIMAKVKLQWKPPSGIKTLSKEDQEKIRYRSSWDVLTKVYRENGAVGWYQGMQAQINKAVLCQAIIFVLKDYLHQVVVKLRRTNRFQG